MTSYTHEDEEAYRRVPFLFRQRTESVRIPLPSSIPLRLRSAYGRKHDIPVTKNNNVIEQFLLPLAEAVSGWSTLAAIRSALIVTLPLMFLGSLAELMISFPLDAYKEFMFRQFGPEWRMFGQILKDATFSVMSLIMVFSIGHHLTDQFNHDNPVLRANPVIAGLVAFTAFFCLLQQDGDALNRRWLGVAGLFVAILVGVFATRLFLHFFSIKRLHLHLPGGTPDIADPAGLQRFHPRHVDRARVRGPWRGYADICGHVSA